MYNIEYMPAAVADLRYLKWHEQARVLDGIEAQLRYQPMVETRQRKRMRPNDIAEWELRIGEFRVLYTVDEAENRVAIQRIGEKVGNTFRFRGRETPL